MFLLKHFIFKMVFYIGQKEINRIYIWSENYNSNQEWYYGSLKVGLFQDAKILVTITSAFSIGDNDLNLLYPEGWKLVLTTISCFFQAFS